MNYADYAKLFVGVKQGSTKHKRIIDKYNTIKPLPCGYKVKYTDNWCATFVSFVLYSCKAKKNIYECGAERMRKKCIKQKLTLKDKTQGKRGDIIFYDWNSDKWCDHVGIIYKSSGDYYTVIEGNKNKRVEMRLIKKNSGKIFTVARL